MYLTKQQYVYTELRRQIQEGKLRPGTWLATAELGRQFGVSAIPVREALRQLENEDLVEIKPHTRAIVKGVSADDALWVAELRLVLEPRAARDATGLLDEEALAKLQSLIDQMDPCVERKDIAAYRPLNQEFHSTIYGFTPNVRLQHMITELWETAQRFALIFSLPGHIEQGQREHRAIVGALKGGDPDQVEQEVFKHRLRILQKVKSWLAKSGSSAK